MPAAAVPAFGVAVMTISSVAVAPDVIVYVQFPVAVATATGPVVAVFMSVTAFAAVSLSASAWACFRSADTFVLGSVAFALLV